MNTWQIQDAKARFSELLRAVDNDGPQLVTHRGRRAAVVVKAEEWEQLQNERPPSLKQLLTSPRHTIELPEETRGRLGSRLK